MARTADKPGTFRIKERDGRWYVSGVDEDGERIRGIPANSAEEAKNLAKRLFTKSQVTNDAPLITAPSDWSVPIRVKSDTVASMASAVGLPTGGSLPTVPTGAAQPAGGNPPTAVVKKDNPIDEKKVKRAKNAESLAGVFGVGWAAGTVYGTKRLLEATDHEPLALNPRQVNDLADSFKDAISSSFGDREIGPWTMVLLLTLGLPIGALIQAKKKPPKTSEEASRQSHLKPVP